MGFLVMGSAAASAQTLRIGGKMVSARDFPANYSVRQMLNAWGRNNIEIPYGNSMFFMYYVGDEALLVFEFAGEASLTRAAYIQASAQPRVPTLLAGGAPAYARSPAALTGGAVTMLGAIQAWGLPSYTMNRTSDGHGKRWFYEFPDGACRELNFLLEPPFAAAVRECDPEPLRPRPNP